MQTRFPMCAAAAGLAAAIAVLALGPGGSSAADPLRNKPSAVTEVRIVGISPSGGDCPMRVGMSGSITMNGPGDVSYGWYTDAWGSVKYTEHFDQAGTHTVSFAVDADHQSFGSTLRLAVESPNKIEAAAPAPKIACRIPPVHVALESDPGRYSGPCPANFTFTATVQSWVAETVTYQWLFAGAPGPTGRVKFTGPGIKKIVEHRAYPVLPDTLSPLVQLVYTDLTGKRVAGYRNTSACTPPEPPHRQSTRPAAR